MKVVMPTIDAVLRDAIKRVEPVSSSANLDAQVLLMAVLAVNRAYLLAHPEQPLTPQQHEQYTASVERCAAGEPVAYILGWLWRSGLDLHLAALYLFGVLVIYLGITRLVIQSGMYYLTAP